MSSGNKQLEQRPDVTILNASTDLVLFLDQLAKDDVYEQITLNL